MMQAYPEVIGELETIQHILATKCSLARFGDGEVKLMAGASQIREPANEKLGAELREVIADADPRCIVGIPSLAPDGPKYRNWVGRAPRFLPYLNKGVTYYSSFVSRPDSAPWISTQQYAEAVQDIWLGRRTILVCERTNKIFNTVREKAGALKHFTCPHTKTYEVADEIVDFIVRGRHELAILSCGPAATCIAWRLSKLGVQAIDIGSIGGFMLKMLDLEPLGDLRTVSIKRPDGMTVEEMKDKLNAEWDVKYFDDKER